MTSEQTDYSGLSKAWQLAQDNAYCAVFGCRDKDTGENKKDLLLSRFHKLATKRMGWNGIRYKYLYCSYRYEYGTESPEELFIMVFNITKDEAIGLARGAGKGENPSKYLNLETILWKDPGFFGFFNVAGRTPDVELNRDSTADSKENLQLFKDRLLRHAWQGQKKPIRFTVVHFTPPGRCISAIENMSSGTKHPKEVWFEVDL